MSSTPWGDETGRANYFQSGYNTLLEQNQRQNDEIAALRAELDAFKARWTETASDNTEYTLSHLDGIYSVCDPDGCVVCEFIRDAALEGGQQ